MYNGSMTTIKGKPTGYFEKLLAFDCETTGLSFNSDDPSVGHQAVSWGLIVADAETLKPIEELYVEIKWNEDSIAARKADPTFGKKAEKIHGLTFEYLEKNGLDEEEAVVKIANLIIKHWGPTVSVRTLGHNGITFDLPFFKQLLRKYDLPVKFGNRHYDTNSIGFATFGSFTSDQLFEAAGLDTRGTHNALDDARYALEVTRRVRVLFGSLFDG